jgi:FkbM family methyltransferase
VAPDTLHQLVVEDDLVYDVGMSNGDDSAYYLSKGLRVVAVEANPLAAAAGAARFGAEIESGRMTILNVGVAEEEGESVFWVCDDHMDWSSFNRHVASRRDSRHHPVTVRTRPFGDIVREHGLPLYCKIDIEGNDALCLRAFTPQTRPRYVSIEAGPRVEQDLETLRSLGYDAFKIVGQRRLVPASEVADAVLSRVPDGMRDRAEGLDRRLRGRRADGDWEFAFGSSGPFGERTPGRWMDHRRAVSLAHHIVGRFEGGDGGRWAEWYDVHATTRRGRFSRAR